MVTKILERDRSLMRIQNDEGLTSLHCAAAEIHKEEHLNILLRFDTKKESSAVYIRDNKGRTALHIAMLQSNWKALWSLIDARPDCLEVVDENGQNVIHYGAKLTSGKIMERLLLSAGYLDKLINKRDVNGNTPFHILADSIVLTSHLHYSLNNLPSIVKKNTLLNLKAFNKENLTVGDILLPVDSLLRQERILGGHQFPRGKRVNSFEREDTAKKAPTNIGEWNVETIKRAAQNRLVVAALIATVSFTAGFTVPGGLDQNMGESIGMAVFRRKTSFKVFLVTDAIAFVCSTLAILCYFVLVSTEAKWVVRSLSIMGLTLNTISLGALVIAFLAGVSAISSNPLGLVVAISGIFFFCYCSLIVRNFQTLSFIWRNMDVRDLMNIIYKTASNAT